jgi:hypothetical protein
MANPSKPPPGNTTTATPVFFPVGEYSVIVGRVTFFTQTYGLPATVSSLRPPAPGRAVHQAPVRAILVLAYIPAMAAMQAFALAEPQIQRLHKEQ